MTNPPAAPETADATLIVMSVGTCTACKGTGDIPDRGGPAPCWYCNGKGQSFTPVNTYVAVPAAAVPDAALLAAMGRLLKISQLAQAVLVITRETLLLDSVGKRLLSSLDAETLQHDQQRCTAYLTQQEPT